MLARRHDDRHCPGSGPLLLRSPAHSNRPNSSIPQPRSCASARTDQVRERDGYDRRRRRPARVLFAGAVSMALTCSGCGLVSGSKAPQPSASVVRPGSARSLAPGAASVGPPPRACPNQVFARMSEAQRVGQDELRAAFSDGWTIIEIQADTFAINREAFGTATAQAWLATISRDGLLPR